MDKIKVLVVEDSALIAEDIAFKLGKHHFHVVGIFDKGEDAIEFLKKTNPTSCCLTSSWQEHLMASQRDI